MRNNCRKIGLTFCKATVRCAVALVCLAGGAGTGMAQVAAPVADGVAPVTSANTRRQALRDQWLVDLLPDPAMAALPIVDPTRSDPVAGQLRRLYAQGKAAGLAGVLYDNRDRGHSALAPGAFPQMARVVYDQAFLTQMLDHGLAGRMTFSLPVIGNSSTAFTKGPLERSIGRMATGSQADASRANTLYLSNHFYVYPEHRDHDVDKGDRMFAMTPHFALSQGSSRTDRPVMEAVAEALAALQPETRARAEAMGLLAPTAQMILRRSLSGVRSDADYLTARAHPTAFAGNLLRPSVMVALANSIAPDALPPVVKLSVVRDFSGVPGRDFLAGNLGEVLFTTSTAIGRAWRGLSSRRDITLDVTGTEDPSGRELTFHWVVVKGDPEKVRILPEDARGGRVTIEMDWHDPATVAPPTTPRPSRIEVAVIADNGVHLSAPSFFSVSLPLFQNRDYAQPGDPVPRSMNYRADPGDPYADPLIWPKAAWTDSFEAEASGGWVLRRDHGGGAVLTLRKSGLGYVTANGPVTHVARKSQKGPLVLVTVRADGTDQ